MPALNRATTRPMTQRSEAERPRPETAAGPPLLEALPTAVFTLDAGGVVRSWNGAAESVFGVPAAHALGRPLASLPLPATEAWQPVLDAARAGTEPVSLLLELPAMAAGATARVVELTATAVPGDAAGDAPLLVSAYDVTTHVRARQHAERRAEEMAAQAVRRDLFFSAMSHDLRTPITAVMGYSELLLDGVVGELSERQLEMVERVSQVAGHLSQLLNDVLDLAKLDAGRMELRCEPVALDALLSEALVEVEPQARGKGLEIRCEIGALEARRVMADAVRARQVLVNLVANAVKFTDAGEVRLSADVEGGIARVRVRDTGPGLPDGEEEAVFEEYVQVASGRGAKQQPGSGLGLAISRRLARAMGGELRAESLPGRGACFVFTLPLAEEREG
jgi:signal transduction histidine kinase